MSNLIPLELKATRSLAPNTLHLVFERDEATPFAYTPGHFVSLHFEHRGEAVRRSYSIATSSDDPAGNPALEFAISFVPGGKASDFFFNAPLGTHIQMSGPFGLLLLPEELPKRMILVSTGTGVAPYRAMLPRLASELAAHPDKEVVLLFGCRRRGEELYGEEFRAFAAQHPNLRYYVALSREEPVEAHERKGYVQHTLAALSPRPETDMIYLCGNPPMVDEVFAGLKEQGFGVKNVRREKYVFAAK